MFPFYYMIHDRTPLPADKKIVGQDSDVSKETSRIEIGITDYSFYFSHKEESCTSIIDSFYL